MSGLVKLDPRLGEVFHFTRGIDPNLLTLQKSPGWQDIEDFKDAIQKLRLAKADLKAQGKLEEAYRLAEEASARIAQDSQTKDLLAGIKSTRQKEVYSPTEYDLKKVYADLIYEFDKEVPPYLRIPIRHLPYDLRKITLVPAAEKIVQRQEQLFQPFFKTSGFADLNSFETAVSESGEVPNRLLQMLKNGEFEFAMNRPENARWWVPKVGFQNASTTGREDSYLTYRNTKEAGDTLHQLSEYLKFDPELKPEYGYLRPKPESGFTQSKSADSYGSDVYVFKPAKVQKRVTWTQGNSELYAKGTAEGPVAEEWESFMVPFSHRTLGVPGLMPKATNEKIAFEFQSGPQNFQSKLTPPPGRPEQPRAPDTLPQPQMPPMPTPPPMPEPRPVPPPMPSPIPVAPAQPARPASTGDKVADEKAMKEWNEAIGKYFQSKEYADYQVIYDDYMAKYQSTSAYVDFNRDWTAYQKGYQSSPVYIDFIKMRNKLNQDYINSQIYKDWVTANQKIYEDWMKTPEYLKFQDDTKVFESSQPWLDYVAAQTKELRDAFLGPLLDHTPLKDFKFKPRHSYFELQYWGPVDLNDVAVFEFRQNPPSGEFLQELKKRNIVIRDGRVKPAVIWVEPKE